MAYPSGYHSDIISLCSLQEKKNKKKSVGKNKVGMSLVLVFFMAKKMSLFQMWRVGDAVNVILLLMEKGQGFSVFPKGALNGFVSFPLQVCPTAGSLQLGDFVSGLCSLYAGLCDLHCHEECKCPPSVQMGGGLRCTGHSTNDRRLAVRSSVRKNRGESAKE